MLNLLIVDDNEADTAALSEMLEPGDANDYHLILADRLAAAFRMLASEPVELIILDLFLPESKGIATLKRFKTKAPNLPVIALTRFDDELTGLNAVREGAQDYLVKGHFNEHGLKRSISHALERHRTEIAIRQKNAELEVLNQKLLEADRLKSIFVANMSHELRTPLNSIIGFTNIILKGMSGDINEDQCKQLTMVKNNGEHLLQLINEVLDVSKIEAGRIEISHSRFDFNELVSEITSSFTPQINKKNLRLSMGNDLTIELHTDRVRLKQILMNLTNNAVKFTDAGEISIDHTQLPGGKIQISIRDTGIGIRKENMSMLFVAFHQIDMSMTKKYQGTGLGLHLSQKLAHLLGGIITAESEFGKGSRFELTIPAIHPDAGKKTGTLQPASSVRVRQPPGSVQER